MDKSPLFENVELALDAENLEYISSAGLRVLLKLKKRLKKELTVRNVSDEVFDIFDVTGFSDIFNIERQMRRISIKGCKKINTKSSLSMMDQATILLLLSNSLHRVGQM